MDERKLSGRRKAAILCITLGEELAADVFRQLSPTLVERDGKVVPTGRGEQGGTGGPITTKGSPANDRLMGADR